MLKNNMNIDPKKISIIALIIAFSTLGLELKRWWAFDGAVRAAVEAREREYCVELAKKLNFSRELMGQPKVSPGNFAELLEAYFDGMAAVMERDVGGGSEYSR